MRALLILSLLCPATLARANPDEVRPAPPMPTFETTPPPAWIAMPPRAPSPAPERERGGRRWGIFGAGLALFAVGYAADVGTTYGLHHLPSSTSLIPLAGPLMQLSDRYSVMSTPQSSGIAQVDAQAQSATTMVNQAVQTVVTIGLVVDFALQLTGVVMAAAGVLSHHRVETRRWVLAPTGALRCTF